MSLVSDLAQHLGLVVLTSIAFALTAYLLYVMARPEKF